MDGVAKSEEEREREPEEWNTLKTSPTKPRITSDQAMHLLEPSGAKKILREKEPLSLEEDWSKFE